MNGFYMAEVGQGTQMPPLPHTPIPAQNIQNC